MLELDLTAPSVSGVIDGFLDPEQVPAAGIAITVPHYTNMEVGQWLSARLTSADPASSYDIPPQEIAALGAVILNIPKNDVIKNQDQAVSLSYSVSRTREALAETSKSLPFFVGGHQGSTWSCDFEDTSQYHFGIDYLVAGGLLLEGTINMEMGQDFPPVITGRRVVEDYSTSNNRIKGILSDRMMSVTMGIYVSTECNGWFVYREGANERMPTIGGAQWVSSNPNRQCKGFEFGVPNGTSGVVMLDNLQITYK
ncbi:MAG: hypothetical protein EOO88_61685 [Pedobacter sp.]|nr:MAG: hypothetical protein EOO88_61685 [Pedobacter sp.]